MIVKESMGNVDKLISSVKAAIVKNKSRRDLFSDLKTPPTPIPTRWGTWLEAVNYYCENLPAIKQIFREEKDGIIMSNVKQGLADKNLTRDLAKIQRCYMPLIESIKILEDRKTSLRKAIESRVNQTFFKGVRYDNKGVNLQRT